MHKPINNCFVIPINGDFLFYSPLNGLSALINGSGVKELKKQLQFIHSGKPDTHSEFFELANEITNGQVLQPLRRERELNPEFLGIIPTRSCNGICNYCDFGAANASSETMSVELAAKTVDWYAGVMKSLENDILEIHFFGGEPMMARDVVEVAVHRARLVSVQQELMPFFEISTNGQYSKEEAGFLGEYFNKVVLSLDGFRETQDLHRPVKGSKSGYEQVVETAKILSHSNAELCIRCCVSDRSLDRMEEITSWLCQEFKIAAINFEILCETPRTELKELYPPDPIDFAIHFQRSRKIASAYGVEVVYASDISNNPQLSSCPVGKDAVIVSPDGRISNCYLLPEKWQQRGLDLDFGQTTSKGGIEIDQQKLIAIREMVEDKARCKSCFCQWSCAGGCHVGNTYPGSSLEYDHFCRQTRLISAFTLLTDLGLEDKVEELISSKKKSINIIDQHSDLIEDFYG